MFLGIAMTNKLFTKAICFFNYINDDKWELYSPIQGRLGRITKLHRMGEDQQYYKKYGLARLSQNWVFIKKINCILIQSCSRYDNVTLSLLLSR